MRLVYLSPVPWTSFKQRPHKFVEWYYSRNKDDVLWVDPYPGRLPVKSDFRRFLKDSDNKKELEAEVIKPPWLTVIPPLALPIEPVPVFHLFNRLLWRAAMRRIDVFFALGECMLAIGKPSDMAIQVLTRHPGVFSVYEAMDDFPEFHKGISKTAMKNKDRIISARVSKIHVSSTKLTERYDTYKTKLSVIRNACSVDELPPPGYEHATSKATILGYIGTISHWFDWDVVISLAEANPDATVRLIGPDLAPASQPLPANIEMLPACKHEDAITAMQDFSVGLIPFKQSVLTDSVDPIKYYEYRAMGLPVLTTAFGEMALRTAEKGVFFMDMNSDFSAIVKKAAGFEYTVEEIQEFRNANSWEKRFDWADRDK